jgi:hypothetical protein
MKNRLRFLPGLSCLVLGLSVGAWASASAITNEEFATKVRAYRGQMAHDERAVTEASLLCAYLPEHRVVEEPKCVALRGYFRAEATKAKAKGPTQISASGELSPWSGISLTLAFG